jgi:hypothetical protein
MFEKILLFLSLLILCVSCEYENTEDYHNKVDTNVAPPQIQTVALNLEEDSIYLYSSLNINFWFTSNKQKISAVRFLVDNIERKVVTSSNGVFELNSYSVNENTHTLTIEVYTASGTGSLADQIGAETFVFSKTWTLIVDNSYFTKTKASVHNGLLKLSWPKCHIYDLKEYKVYRTIGWNYYEIGKTSALEFIDSTYVGEGEEYSVRAITGSGTIVNWGTLQLNQDLPSIKFVGTQTNDYHIYWNKCKYYNAIDTLVLSQLIGYGYLFNKVKSIQNPNDTTYNITNALFGDRVSFKIKLIPRWKNLLYNTAGYNQSFENQMVFILGIPILNSFSDIHQINSNEFICVSNNSLIKYSLSQMKVTDKLTYSSDCSVFYSLGASPLGGSIISYSGCNDNLMLVSSSNLQNYSFTNLKYLTGQQYVPKIILSDAGTGIVQSSNNRIYIYDFKTSSVLGSYYPNTQSNFHGFKISSNGEYFFGISDSLRLYRFHNQNFSKIWTTNMFDDSGRFYEFIPNEDNKLVIWNGQKFYVKHCDDFSTIYEFPLAGESLLNIEYYTKEILTYKTGHLLVRSMVDGTLLKDIPINITPNYWEACYLMNHYIISVNGVIYYI